MKTNEYTADLETLQEPLLSLRPKTDFEKYLWACHELKEQAAELSKARVQVGMLKDEIEYLKQTYEIKPKNLTKLWDATPDELRKIIQRQHADVSRAAKKIKELKEENEILKAQIK